MREMSLNFSFATFRTGLKRAKIRFGEPKKVLKVSPSNVKKRMAFAKKSRNHNWRKTIFIDEKVFRIGLRGAAVHCRIGEQPVIEVSDYGGAVAV